MQRVGAFPWQRLGRSVVGKRQGLALAGRRAGAAAYSREGRDTRMDSTRPLVAHMPTHQCRIGSHALQWHEHTPLAQVADDIRQNSEAEVSQDGPLSLTALDQVEIAQERGSPSMRRLHVETNKFGLFLIDRSPEQPALKISPNVEAIRSFVQELQGEAEKPSQIWDVYQCDSVRKKRKRMMNKHKHRKAKKKQRHLLRKLGKI